ncbi:hypothetical protein AX15_004795 [Amanita polypyramis BW_CC]|nr:hypothetical protein AX15_004795 [Amanita polypyramis BW_CC]
MQDSGQTGSWPSPLTTLIDQDYLVLPHFTLECGIALEHVPIAYKTWGTLNATHDNVMIICHAFAGGSDVEDWWGPLVGRGKAFDASRFFIFCANVLGSPYGTASCVTVNPATGRRYGPEFPPTTVRDDVRLHKEVLDRLGVKGVAVVIGGSMGGMMVLEWPLVMNEMGARRENGGEYVKRIIPLATSARHSAWCISWGEAQRQSIYADPEYRGGYYYLEEGEGKSERQPKVGLAAARMAALLTYRSRDSFESRFGRRIHQTTKERTKELGVMTPPDSPKFETADDMLMLHNDGHIRTHTYAYRTAESTTTTTTTTTPLESGRKEPERPPIFSAQSYLRYQGDKFTARFDANCYIHITRKLDSHDLARGRVPTTSTTTTAATTTTIATTPDAALTQVLTTLPPALVISIATDGLFTTSEQKLLAQHIPNSELVVIPSEDGHDGFLLEFERINECVLKFLKKELPEYYYYKEGGGEAVVLEEEKGDFKIRKASVFGEAEADVTNW